jgi:GR25 family glycosyltransferase involved in LPS biosynthesis
MWVINLDRRQDRLELFMRSLEKMHYTAERFPAVDGMRLEETLGSLLKDRQEFLGTLLEINKNLKRGEVGCFLSHYLLLHKISLRESPLPVVIFEDDAKFSSNRLDEALRLVHNFEDEYDIIFIGGRFERCRYPEREYKLSHRAVITDRTTSGYIVTPQSAKRLVEMLEEFIKARGFKAIDQIYKILQVESRLVTYDLEPHIVYSPVDPVESDIQGAKNRKYINLHMSNGKI